MGFWDDETPPKQEKAVVFGATKERQLLIESLCEEHFVNVLRPEDNTFAKTLSAVEKCDFVVVDFEEHGILGAVSVSSTWYLGYACARGKTLVGIISKDLTPPTPINDSTYLVNTLDELEKCFKGLNSRWIEKVRLATEEREEQRRSFAYGNANLDNENITRDLINKEADKIDPFRDAVEGIPAAKKTGDQVSLMESINRIITKL